MVLNQYNKILIIYKLFYYYTWGLGIGPDCIKSHAFDVV